MANSEGILKQLMDIMQEHQIDIIDALVLLCEEQDIEPNEVVKSLDANLVARLQQTAIESRRVIIPQNKLPFE